MDYSDIISPTLILRPEIAKRNIRRMADKAKAANVEFRPHFKTHQSLTIGHWFKMEGVTKITVSSLSMAEYFASGGWDDITIAIPVNIREIPRISKLAAEITLNIIVDSPRTVAIINHHQTLENPVRVWIEADCGDGRTGIPLTVNKKGDFVHLAQSIDRTQNMEFAGIMMHAGHSYRAMSIQETKSIYQEIVENLTLVLDQMRKWPEFKDKEIPVSFGDTPMCSRLELFPGMSEIRPGNFIFNDFMQYSFGVCEIDDIAVAMACPVISSQTNHQFVVHGGAVHFSKDYVLTGLNRKPVSESRNFGWQVAPNENGWRPFKDNYLSQLSQEHGEVWGGSSQYSEKTEGEIAFFLPVHSCLTADLMMRYYLWENDALGEEISMMKSDPRYLNGFET